MIRAKRWLKRVLAALGALVLAKVLWFCAARDDARALAAGGGRDGLLARRAFVVRRATAQGFGPSSFTGVGDPYRGEWCLVTLSMTAVAVHQIAAALPDTRADAERDLDTLARRALDPDVRDFDRAMWGEDPLATLAGDHGHVGYLGHLAFILGLRCAASPCGDLRARLDELLAALARRFTSAPALLIETYPEQTFVADNAVALAALALAGSSLPRAHLTAIAARYADPALGLLPFRVTRDGVVLQGPRGSGSAWNVFYLAWVDRAFADAEYWRMKKAFYARPLGIAGIREGASGDVDSGPLLLGLSPSASAFAIAGARRAGDLDAMQALLDTAELAGFTWGGRYLVGPVLGDAVVLAMKTAQ